MATLSNTFYDLLGRFGLFSKQREKSFFKQRVQILGNQGAVYIPTDVPYNLFESIPELNQVISKKADMFSNGVFKLVKVSDGKEVEDKELIALLENPNILQPQNKWLNQIVKQLDTYGNQFIYMNKPSILKKYPSSLTNISPCHLRPITTGKFYDQIEMSGIIKNYEYMEGINKKTFETNTIIWNRHDDLDNPLIGCSPLKPLQYPLTNTKLAYDYLNSISGEKGAIGMVSTMNKDSMGTIPLNDEDKKELERKFQNDYGVGDDAKNKVVFVDGVTGWTPMSYPTAQLQLLEQIDANKLTICDHFGLNINIFSSKAQTYENVKNALIQCYTDTIIPFADSFTQKLGKELGIDKAYRLVLDYSHIAILKADKKSEGEIIGVQLANIKQALDMNLINEVQAKQAYESLIN